MRAIINRYEGDYAVCRCEDRTMLDIEISSLPKDAKEGTVIIIREESIVIDRLATYERQVYINHLTESMWE